MRQQRKACPQHNQEEERKADSTSTTRPQKWSFFIVQYAHTPVLLFTRWLARISALHPKRTIVSIIFLSFAIFYIGISTNFYVDVNTDEMWSPIGSNPVKHARYIEETFDPSPRSFYLLFHAYGDSIIAVENFRHMFAAIDVVRAHHSYQPACTDNGDVIDRFGQRTCDIYGVTKFWWNNLTEFEAEVAISSSSQFLHEITARRSFVDGIPVLHEEIFGYLDYNSTYVKSAQSTTILINLPDDPRIRQAEPEMVRNVLALNGNLWNDTEFCVQVLANDSIPNELIRSVNQDIPLIPIIFVVMALFTSLVFSRHHRVYSRAILGAGAVVAILLSLATGFGLLFIIGTPFSTFLICTESKPTHTTRWAASITQLLPFLIFGIGLDDAFILVGSYTRTSPQKTVVERIDETVCDVGLSIFLTTLTSAIAFALGCSSSIPVVFWLCQYCFPTIIIVFIYQLTFFIACITLDEQRIQDGRRDVFFCVKVKEPIEAEILEDRFADRIMKWYAYQLLRPTARVVVALGFAGLLGACIYSATMMHQQFNLTDVLPRDSYAVDFLQSSRRYRKDTLLTVQVVFRNVDQSDAILRREMTEYIDELSRLEFSLKNSSRSDTHWTKLFNFFTTFNSATDQTFNEQLDEFLSIPLNNLVAGHDIVRDGDGNIVASRARIKFAVDLEDVQSQINLLESQRAVTLAQPVNQGREDDLAFFAFDDIFTVFEFYVESVGELASTTVIGVCAVTLVAFAFIPHWTAALFVCPLICILYIDLIGVMKWGGLHINSLTFITLTMSIGLLVDFVMHMLFRYYEVPGNRFEKTVEMLRTMGSSILLGGTTTFLGTLPLMFTSSDAFRIMFVSFVGIVTIGVSHGLVLLPVVLATIGPEDEMPTKSRTETENSEEESKSFPNDEREMHLMADDECSC